MNSKPVVLGNVYDKYGTRNPVARLLVSGFLGTIQELIEPLVLSSVLEVGCGEGHLARRVLDWKQPARMWGADLSAALFDIEIRRRYPNLLFCEQSAYRLGFPDHSVDLVVASEVLEHLDDPEAALREICRVSRRYVLLSVPREPLWRLLNLARFTYLKEVGNTPGHLQHWSSRGFIRMVGRHFRIQSVRRPFPWTVILGLNRQDKC